MGAWRRQYQCWRCQRRWLCLMSTNLLGFFQDLIQLQSPQRTQRTQSVATIIFATFALFAVRFRCVTPTGRWTLTLCEPPRCRISLAWNTKYGDAKYDDGADLNSDDWVNVIDGALVGLNWGRKAQV